MRSGNETPPFRFEQESIGDHAEETSASNLARSDLPSIRLERYSRSRSWQVRYLMALHEETQLETRLSLSHDGNRYVRAAARMMLGKMEKTESGVQND